MAAIRGRWSEAWRVLAYTAAIAIAFVALQRLELALFDAGLGNLLARSEFLSKGVDVALARQAAQVREESKAALAEKPGRQLSAFRMGHELGFASAYVGSFALSPAPVLAQARAIGEPHVALARELGQRLDVADVAALPVRDLKQFAALNDRFEADENGLATRVERRLSPLHRHLYVLGLYVGGEAARIEGSGGNLTQPPSGPIRRHATLAGIAPALWEPLAAEGRGESPAQVLSRYRSGLDTLRADLAARDADGAEQMPAHQPVAASAVPVR